MAFQRLWICLWVILWVRLWVRLWVLLWVRLWSLLFPSPPSLPPSPTTSYHACMPVWILVKLSSFWSQLRGVWELRPGNLTEHFAYDSSTFLYLLEAVLQAIQPSVLAPKFSITCLFSRLLFLPYKSHSFSRSARLSGCTSGMLMMRTLACGWPSNAFFCQASRSIRWSARREYDPIDDKTLIL